MRISSKDKQLPTPVPYRKSGSKRDKYGNVCMIIWMLFLFSIVGTLFYNRGTIEKLLNYKRKQHVCSRDIADLDIPLGSFAEELSRSFGLQNNEDISEAPAVIEASKHSDTDVTNNYKETVEEDVERPNINGITDPYTTGLREVTIDVDTDLKLSADNMGKVEEISDNVFDGIILIG